MPCLRAEYYMRGDLQNRKPSLSFFGCCAVITFSQSVTAYSLTLLQVEEEKKRKNEAIRRICKEKNEKEKG